MQQNKEQKTLKTVIKKMKLFRYSIIRALAAIVAGILLLKYQGATLKGLTIGLGLMFLVAGIVAIVSWIRLRRQKVQQKMSLDDTILPIVGIGSFILGLVLSLMLTHEFDIWSLYIVGGSILLGCLNQMMNLHAGTKFGQVANWLWIAPVLIGIACVVGMIKGLTPPETSTKILGIASLVYAVVDVVYSLILNSMRNSYEQTQEQVRRAESTAIVVEN